jgi:hypothetical protein
MASFRRDPGAVGLSPLVIALGGALAPAALPRKARAQQAQNPSPMVEHTRPHPRLAEARPPGRREELALGTLFVPQRLVNDRRFLVSAPRGTGPPAGRERV